MAEAKTKLNDAPVADFINAIADEQTRQDCWTIIGMMQEAAKAEPKMWGTAIVGFGSYPITYANGKQADWMQVGFSPRKQAITLYGVEHVETLMPRLGKYTTGKGCIYIKRLSDVDLPTLKEMVKVSVEHKGSGS